MLKHVPTLKAIVSFDKNKVASYQGYMSPLEENELLNQDKFKKEIDFYMKTKEKFEKNKNENQNDQQDGEYTKKNTK